MITNVDDKRLTDFAGLIHESPIERNIFATCSEI
jgi:hypothetical protein